VAAEMTAMLPGTVQRDIFSWNAKLAQFVKGGQHHKAMKLFQQMQQEGLSPDKLTFLRVLNACAGLRALDEGRRIHSQIIESGYGSDVFVGSCLVNMYAKCGTIEEAQRVFNKMSAHDVVSWTAMILGYAKCGEGHKALALYQQMQQEGVKPNCVTFVGVLNACASVLALKEGQQVHEQINESGFESDVFVGNSLVNMYTKCGSIEEAWRVFNSMPTRNVVAWTAMISGLVKCGEGQKALALYQQMQREGVRPDPITYVGVLNACASAVALEEGRHVHKQITESRCESDVFVAASLVDMYVKCGSLEEAWRVFNRMPVRNSVAWTAMILGHVKCGEGQKALGFYHQMQCEGVEPDAVTYIGVLNACASVLALEEGRHVHEQIVQCGYDSDVFVGNSLIDMYAKCGSIEDAQRVFNKMPKRDVISWTAMLGGYSLHGHGKEALDQFEWMCKEGVEINDVTFVVLLSACSRAGLVDEGLHFFDSMGSVFCVSASLQHYTCIVDLLGRAGHLQKAEDFIKMTSCESNVVLWMSLLGACRSHGNVEMGEVIAKRVLALDPGNSAEYVCSNIYTAAAKRNPPANVQHQKLERGMHLEYRGQ
jgi:pentatricopeptide repeat protein